MNMFRYFHSTIVLHNINKTALAKLRKKTGYTFSNCRKALELHANDVNQAEKWLHEQAQALGWSKATKLEGRNTTQGLIGVVVQNNRASMVEVNCETDFVARNTKFQSLLELITTCTLDVQIPASTEPIHKIALGGDELKELKAEDGKSLADHLALVIGNVSENITIRRALCLKAAPGVAICGLTHPAPSSLFGTLFGKYGAIVAYRTAPSLAEENRLLLNDLGKQLCQHVIGMNPKKIGILGEDDPNKHADDETTMIHQEFLMDPTITVGQLLQDAGTTLLNFERFECGERLGDNVEESQQQSAAEI